MKKKKKEEKEEEEGWLKWWRGNRLEKCREDRKIVKNDAPRWTGAEQIPIVSRPTS